MNIKRGFRKTAEEGGRMRREDWQGFSEINVAGVRKYGQGGRANKISIVEQFGNVKGVIADFKVKQG